MWSMQTYPKVRKNLKFQERQSEFENSVRTYGTLIYVKNSKWLKFPVLSRVLLVRYR